MKSLLAALTIWALALGVTSASALEITWPLIVYGPDLTYDPGQVPVGIAPRVSAPVLFTKWGGSNPVYGSEETIALEDGFALERIVAESRGITISDLGKEPPREGGIIDVYRAIGHPNPWLGQDGE